MLTSHDGIVVWQREGGEGRYESLRHASLLRHPRKGWEFEPLLVTCIYMLTIFLKSIIILFILLKNAHQS